MTSLTQGLAAQLSGAPVQQIAQQLGIPPEQAQSAVSAALPLLMGALGRNASQPQGAQALHAALQDHAGGDITSVLGSVLGGAMGGAGGGQGDDTLGRMLGHIFGGQQDRAEQHLGEATGLGGDRAGMLMKILAPIVLAYLAKRMFGGAQQGPGNAQALGDILGQERAVQQQQGGLGGGLMNAVLDTDGDGKVDLSDLIRLGSGLLGGRR